jgi:hypothetical protein
MSIVKEAIMIELQSAMKSSKEYSDKVKNAKTKVKSTFYTKKLKSSNQIVADLLIALDKVNNKDYNT